MWELSNEEIWYKGMFNGAWQRLPSFFRNQLLRAWNAFLWDKYGTEEKLVERWQSLLPGESLYQGTVMLAPLARPASAELAVNDSNPQAIESLTMVKQKYTRDDFARARGEDVIEFFTKIWTMSQPTDLPRSSALWSPPAIDMCAPSSMAFPLN